MTRNNVTVSDKSSKGARKWAQVLASQAKPQLIQVWLLWGSPWISGLTLYLNACITLYWLSSSAIVLSNKCNHFLLTFATGTAPLRKSLSVGNHVTARLGSALGSWNPIEQTGLCIYSCFRTYRSELFNRVLSNQQTVPRTTCNVHIAGCRFSNTCIRWIKPAASLKILINSLWSNARFATRERIRRRDGPSAVNVKIKPLIASGSPSYHEDDESKRKCNHCRGKGWIKRQCLMETHFDQKEKYPVSW